MKKTFIALLMAFSLLISMVSVSHAEEKMNPNAETQQEESLAVEAAVDDYFTARLRLLRDRQSESLAAVAVSGIVEDEQKHRSLSPSLMTSYTITSFLIQDRTALLQICELLSSGNCIDHEMILYYTEDSVWIVASDGYYDAESGFASASYVDPAIAASVNGETDIEDAHEGGRPSPCRNKAMINAATGEIGYTQQYDANGNRYTKYGLWYDATQGTNWAWGVAWCASFVSWCADQGGFPTTDFPPFVTCSSGMATFKSMGRFYYSSAYGGTYQPNPGDIFFTGPSSTESHHTGIVTSATSSIMYTIEGNYGSGDVASNSISLTATNLIGFFHPASNHSLGSYNYTSGDLYKHWRRCTSCLTKEYSAHNWVDIFTYYVCSDCGMTAINVPGGLVSSFHEVDLLPSEYFNDKCNVNQHR